jgi:hypothetical protein
MLDLTIVARPAPFFNVYLRHSPDEEHWDCHHENEQEDGYWYFKVFTNTPLLRINASGVERSSCFLHYTTIPDLEGGSHEKEKGDCSAPKKLVSAL